MFKIWHELLSHRCINSKVVRYVRNTHTQTEQNYDVNNTHILSCHMTPYVSHSTGIPICRCSIERSIERWIERLFECWIVGSIERGSIERWIERSVEHWVGRWING